MKKNMSKMPFAESFIDINVFAGGINELEFACDTGLLSLTHCDLLTPKSNIDCVYWNSEKPG